MLEFLKNYYVLMLVLIVFSYLVPKEEYKIYIQFFVSVFIIVLLLNPVMEFFSINDTESFYEIFQQFYQQIDGLDLKVEKGEDIFEHFFSKGERQ